MTPQSSQQFRPARDDWIDPAARLAPDLMEFSAVRFRWYRKSQHSDRRLAVDRRAVGFFPRESDNGHRWIVFAFRDPQLRRNGSLVFKAGVAADCVVVAF